MTSKAILIATGGTGGHIFPGLAVASEFKSRGYQVHWLGTRQGMEATLVPAANIPLHFFPVTGIRGKGILALFIAPFNILKAVYVALKKIKEIKPRCVVGLGGFVAGPAGFASKLLGLPLVIHEQNAIAGTTNRLLAKIANKVLCAFPDTLKNAEVIGNPVRTSIESMEKRFENSGEKIHVLVMGGSRGARALNLNVAKAVAEADIANQVVIRHQCGAGRIDEAIAAYKKEGIDAEVIPFIDDMEQALLWADFLICRAGALTVSEVAAAGIASVMVPYPYAIDDHQTANAQYLEDMGATEIVQESEFESGKLVDALTRILSSRATIQSMSCNAKQAGRRGVAKTFVDICESIPGVAL